MPLSEEARERLADVVELQPTKNAALQDRWNMESGSEVHSYLETELSAYYFRDDNSLIRATEEAAELVDVEPGVSDNGDGTRSIRVSRLAAEVLEVLPGPEDTSKSVVAVLHTLRNESDLDPSTEDLRGALQSLKRKGVVDVVYRAVPTYRLALPRETVDVSVNENS